MVKTRPSGPGSLGRYSRENDKHRLFTGGTRTSGARWALAYLNITHLSRHCSAATEA